MLVVPFFIVHTVIDIYFHLGRGFAITGLRSVHLVKDIIDFFSSSSIAQVAFRYIQCMSHIQSCCIYMYTNSRFCSCE